MRKPSRIQWTVTLGLACVAGSASAQLDVVPTAPNVMLLVDNSGSMEWKSSGDVDPVCQPATPNTSLSAPNEKSRWIELVETLTGSINNYSCYAEPRNTTAFRTEFQLSPTDPPGDSGWTEPYHRPLSSLCAPGPGVLPDLLHPFDYPPGAITYRPFNGTDITLGLSVPCAFSQSNDGLLDSWNGQIRFGLMTFDSYTDPGTGLTSGGAADYKTGIRGMWSYYYPTSGTSCNGESPMGNSTQCGVTAGCCLGGPWDCTAAGTFEVGARNAAAPPWEGRMVAFGPPADDGTVQDQQIQEILLATRPFGATPIAGMLSDSRDFFWFDTSPDPLHPSPAQFGPSNDPLVQATCRKEYNILLTDGVPNLDLRPDCLNGTTDKCPYATPETIANDLITNPGHAQVRTFVVGFAVSHASIAGADGGTTDVDCERMDLSLCNPTPTDPVLRTCCILNNIAYNGTPIALRGQPNPTGHPEDHAFFPKTPLELRASLSSILQKLLMKSTGRTYPVSVSVAGDSSPGYEFASGTFPLPGGLWQGVLTRKRYNCSQSPPTYDPIDSSKGDDFIYNVNQDPTTRIIFSVQPDQIGSTTVRQAGWSLRPYLLATNATDGVGQYSGTQTIYDPSSTFPQDLAPESLNVTATTCGTTTASACSQRILSWAVGLPTATPQSRCVGGTDCNVIGDIFHSQPQVRSGMPSEFLRDTTYGDFAATLAKRDTMLYVSSNDGFLHGFTVVGGDPAATADNRKTPSSAKDNEQWAFIPPAVLPQFVSMYSGVPNAPLARVPALDGTPIIKDVAVTRTQTGVRDAVTYPYLFERKAQPDAGETHTWRTILVQGYGHNSGGYFAVDITQPSIDLTDPVNTGPKFLWQLSTDDAGKQLFGKGSGTPLITTLFMRETSSSPTREIAVAVLPGGIGDSPTASTGCDGDSSTAVKPADGSPITAYRSTVRCYGQSGGSNNSAAARSLTIVRLDTGQIIRTFRTSDTTVTQPVTFPSSGSTAVLTNYTFDPSTGNQVSSLTIAAPIVGTPVAYPSQTGSVANRIFVGDAEGRIWRVDVSKPDPAAWALNVFFDPYASNEIGQPVQTPPVLSVDESGQITIAYATGDQDNFAPDPDPANPVTHNVVASVTEVVKVNASDGTRVFGARPNWVQSFTGGERVLGPLTLFAKKLYYSSFLQGVSANCNDIGTSTVWAVDYIQPSSTGWQAGGLLVPADASGTSFPQVFTDTVISGVGLRQVPSCSSASSVSDTSGDFLGYGKMTQSTTTTPPTFQLVFNKGGATATGTDKIAEQTIDIKAPVIPARVAWFAPIIE